MKHLEDLLEEHLYPDAPCNPCEDIPVDCEFDTVEEDQPTLWLDA